MDSFCVGDFFESFNGNDSGVVLKLSDDQSIRIVEDLIEHRRVVLVFGTSENDRLFGWRKMVG